MHKLQAMAPPRDFLGLERDFAVLQAEYFPPNIRTKAGAYCGN